MTRQSSAKEAQGYVDKAVPKTCGNCEHFKSDMELPEWMKLQNAIRGSSTFEPFPFAENALEKTLRCELGGFAVKKMATCNQFLAKVDV